MRARGAMVASALVVAVAAFAPLQPLGRSVHVTPVVQSPLRSPSSRQALLATPARPRSSTVVASVSAQAVPRASLVGKVARAVLACVASMLVVILSSARVALAAERTLRRAAPAAGGLAISGDMLKYGFVGACMVAGMVFKKEETPIIRETPGAVTLDPETLAPPAASEPSAAAAPAPEAEPAAEPTAFNIEDDSAIFGSLHARMQSLAAEKDAPAAADADEPADDAFSPPADSTDGWGEGNTAVLEPPRDDEPRGVLDGEPAVEFPPGFPLVDGEVVDNTPAADADQIAMLNRMMGLAADE